MSRKVEQFACLKFSGNSFNPGSSSAWTEEGYMGLAAQLAEGQEFMHPDASTGFKGGLIVPGGGNGGFRGGELEKKHKVDRGVGDRIGMTGTALNSLVLSMALARIGVDHQLFLADSMRIEYPRHDDDIDDQFIFERATPKSVLACMRAGRLAVIGGGSGRYGQSTDSAVHQYATVLMEFDGVECTTFKGTKFGGVYESDPEVAIAQDLPMPRRFDRISVQTMRERDLFAVDPECLDTMQEGGTPMILHSYDAPLVPVLRRDAGVPTTLVLPYYAEPILAAA